MRISDWSSDVCSSDLDAGRGCSVELHQCLAPSVCGHAFQIDERGTAESTRRCGGTSSWPAQARRPCPGDCRACRQAGLTCPAGRERLAFHPDGALPRSEEHTSELQALMRNSHAVHCLNKQNNINKQHTTI